MRMRDVLATPGNTGLVFGCVNLLLLLSEINTSLRLNIVVKDNSKAVPCESTTF